MTTTDRTRDPEALSSECEAFELVLPDYLDRTLEADALALAESHRLHCDRCAALVRDLDMIRASAAQLPALVAPHDLWPAIAERIAAPVVALDVAADPVAMAGATARRARPRAAISLRVAAALILASVGATWLATRRSGGSPTVVAAGATPAVTPAVTAPSAPGPASRSPSVVPVGRKESEVQTYDHEITGLREVLRERQSALDPKTVTVIQRNLAVIDSAIAESRRALAADPHSAFLSDQLDRALDTKMELLRTAALLPART